MKIWRVFWKTIDGESFGGFVQSKTRQGAITIAYRQLQAGCIVTGCVEAYRHQITPQSITLNFKNDTQYELFG